MVGSPPPPRAAMMIARLSLLHSLPRLASMAPFLCLMVAQCECPDMRRPPRCVSVSARRRRQLLQLPPHLVGARVALGPLLRGVQAVGLAPRLGRPAGGPQ